MRGTRALLGALLTAALAGAGLSGCQALQGAAQDRPSGGATSTQPYGYGAEFLAVDECSSFGTKRSSPKVFPPRSLRHNLLWSTAAQRG